MVCRRCNSYLSGKQKARHLRAGLFCQLKNRSTGLDIGGLLALWALRHFKADFLAFLE
jgi:hypothetical protein